jgi:hypothetical protein
MKPLAPFLYSYILFFCDKEHLLFTLMDAFSHKKHFHVNDASNTIVSTYGMAHNIYFQL